MDQAVKNLLEALQKLVGLHREMLNCVRSEKEALISADLKVIQEITYAKEALINSIYQWDKERSKNSQHLAIYLRKPVAEITLSNIIIAIQGNDLKTADKLRSSSAALNLLVTRINEQNAENRQLVETTLHHIQEMKKNVLGEAEQKSETYSSYGKKVNSAGASRLISKEV